MSTHRWIDWICVTVMALSLMVTALFMNGEAIGIERIPDPDAEGYAGSTFFTENDLNGDWDAADATYITLSGDSAKIAGNGAYWLNGSVVIAQSGQYVISGELTDGSIVVDAVQNAKVWILLNGVTVACNSGACIRVDQADKVFLTLAEGSENAMTGGGQYSETALAAGVNGVIFSHDDLTINGSGSLKVTASCLNGIVSKDDLILAGGTICVTAPGHGIRVNDSFRVTAADLTVSAEQDGIHCEGDVVIADGRLTITSGDDAVHSDTSVLILGGSLLAEDCYEGIEAVTIEIRGGDTTIYARDDGLNANGYTGFSFGGGMEQMGEMHGTGETPFAPDGTPFGNNAMREVPPGRAFEPGRTEGGMPEGESGEMTPFDTDPGERKAREQSQTEEKTLVSAEDTWVLISGGNLAIFNENGRDADGIDSNGSITVTGGTVLISLTGTSGNSALDSGSESGGALVITGGTVVACGDSSMAEGFGTDSTQASILYTLEESAAAGSIVALLDAEGRELLRETIPYDFSSIVLSCPGITEGDSCTLRIGETEETIEMTAVSVSAGKAPGAGTFPGNDRQGGGMKPGGFNGTEMPTEGPNGEEAFHPADQESDSAEDEL